MANQDEWVEHFRAFLESSSLLAHDVSGQTHVAQFCADELAPFMESPKAQKYYQRLSESLDELSELSVLFRQFVKDQASESLNHHFIDIHLSCERMLHLHYFKYRTAISFEVDPALRQLYYAARPLAVKSILYALYCLTLESMRLAGRDSNLVTLKILDQKDDGFWNIHLYDEHGLMNLEGIEKQALDEHSFVGKTYRRSNSVVTFKKALRGKVDAVKIANYHATAPGICLSIKADA